MAVERASAAWRIGPTAFLALPLAAAAGADVFYIIALASDDEGLMRVVNGSLPGLLSGAHSLVGEHR